MAVTPRTIFSCPVFAAVAAASLFFFSSVGLLIYETNVEEDRMDRDRPATQAQVCSGVRQMLGAYPEAWSPSDWESYALCFDRHGYPENAVAIGKLGLAHHGKSEKLYRLVSQFQMELNRYKEAFWLLDEALERIERPTTGLLAIRLVRAGLWRPAVMNLDRARTLYQKALDKGPVSCSWIQTGIWVEYARARERSDFEAYRALKNLYDLERRYKPCMARANTGDWEQLLEILGASFVFTDVKGPSGNLPGSDPGSDDQSFERSLTKFYDHFDNVDVSTLCQSAVPLSSVRNRCRDYASDLRAEIDYSNRQIDHEAPSETPSGGGGGGGCLPTY